MPGISLLKQVSGSADGPWAQFFATEVGGPVFYRFTITNTGEVALSSLSISDPTLAELVICEWPGSLAPGDSALCVIGPVPAVAGLHENTASASGSANNVTYTSQPSTAAYATAALTLVKNVQEPSFSAAGDVLHYSFVVTNTGFARLAGPVVVTDDKATDEACPAVTTVGNLDGYLDPQESITCTATYTVTAADVTAGSVTNIASAGAGGFTSNTATKTVNLVVTPVTGISLLKQVSGSADGPWTQFFATEVGGPVFYRFTITNTGEVALSSLSISDPTLAELVICEWPGSLAPGDSALCVIGPVPAVAGLHENTATASGTANNSPVSSSPSTASYATAGLTLVKNVQEPSFSAAGNILHYTYLVTNTGFVRLPAPVVVTDDKATDEACPAVTTVGNLDGYLDPQESITCTATYTVTAADVTAGSVTNLASAGAGGFTSNTATKTVNLVPAGLYKYFIPFFPNILTLPALPGSFALGLGFEDLPMLTGMNDYDYNDFNVTIAGTIMTPSGSTNTIQSLEMEFTPNARGATLRSPVPNPDPCRKVFQRWQRGPDVV